MAFENLKTKIDRMMIELALVATLNKGSKTIAKLGGESISGEAYSDGVKIGYIFTIKKVEWIEGKIYRKTTRIYDLPASLVDDKGLTTTDIENLYGDFLVEEEEVYVNEKNKVVDYQSKKGNIK